VRVRPSILCAPSDSTHPIFSACFMKYVKTKVLKRMEVNKVRGAFSEPVKTLLLPLSFGGSSVAMLHILDEQISAQLERSGHASYGLHIAHIDDSHVNEGTEHLKADLLRERFPTHTFTRLLLEDIFNYNPSEEGILGQKLPLAPGESQTSNRARLDQLLSSLPSASSRVDVLNILRSRLLIAFAKHNCCDAILYGDSTTRLAEKTLSETAKGRGKSVPWLTADGSSPHDIRIIYPMRDLLRKEIIEYTRMISPPIDSLIYSPISPTQVPVSSKTNTIDDLMSQYFASVEQNYPSIVANVVRTASKLTLPPMTSSSLICNVCDFPTVRESQPWGGDQRSPTSDESEIIPQTTPVTCYGCARSINRA
jgi:cytoplasmic tRNA 2-thiolation protein 2